MAHVDDGQLNALLDGELSAEAARDVTSHVASCAECARRLEEARAFLTEAGELLAVLSPPPRAAEPASAEPASITPAKPLIARTAKEIAVSVDGRTEATPAIRPVFKHELPPATTRRGWKMPDLEKLAWAASLVLCLGVGYLANEVYHLRQLQTTDNGRQRQTPTGVAAFVQEPAAVAASPSVRQPASPSVRPSASPSVRRSVGPPAERPSDVSGPQLKPPGGKPAPAFARSQPEQIASNAPTPAPSAGVAQAPAPAAQPSRGALGDVAAAPSAARNASGAGVVEGRANAREEDAVTAPAGAATRSMVTTTFRRVTMDDAVRRLSGSIRLIDGMNPSRVEVGPGRLVSGADPDREVVRVTYASGAVRLVLDQQLGESQGASFNGLMPGDTLVTALGSNGTQVRWLDRKFWLSLTGEMAADSVRAIVERIR